MSTSECGRVVEPAWKSTAQPPNSQYAIRSLEERVDCGERSELARSRVAAVGDEGEGHAVVRDVLIPGGLHERAAIPLREERVAGDVDIDLREEQLVGERKSLGVDLRAADHEDAFDAARSSRASSTDPTRSAPFACHTRVARDDHVAAVRAAGGSGREASPTFAAPSRRRVRS